MSRHRGLVVRVRDLQSHDPGRARELRAAIAQGDTSDPRAARLVASVLAAHAAAEGDAAASASDPLAEVRP